MAFEFFASSAVFSFFCMDVVSGRHRFPMTPNSGDSRDFFLSLSTIQHVGNWQAMVISTYDNVLISLKLIDLYDLTESNDDASKPLTLVPFALRISLYHIPYSIYSCTNPSNVQIDLLPLKRHSYWEQICHLKLFLYLLDKCSNVQMVTCTMYIK